MKIIINIFKFFIQIGLIGLVLASVFTLLTSKTDLIQGYSSFVVVSGSMQPTLKVGSIVLTAKSPTYQIGDVVAFENSIKQVVTHRIVDKASISEGNFYELKGDANNTADNDPVSEKSIIGKSVFAVPYIGKLVQMLKTPRGFIGFVIAPAALFIIWELWNIKKELEKEIEKKYLQRYQKVTFT